MRSIAGIIGIVGSEWGACARLGSIVPGHFSLMMRISGQVVPAEGRVTSWPRPSAWPHRLGSTQGILRQTAQTEKKRLGMGREGNCVQKSPNPGSTASRSAPDFRPGKSKSEVLILRLPLAESCAERVFFVERVVIVRQKKKCRQLRRLQDEGAAIPSRDEGALMTRLCGLLQGRPY